MKRIYISIIIIFTSNIGSAQNQASPNQVISNDSNVTYRLFSTKNTWTFIKLNTRNGQMYQVQWDTEKERFEIPLSLAKRVTTEEEKMEDSFFIPQQICILFF